MLFAIFFMTNKNKDFDHFLKYAVQLYSYLFTYISIIPKLWFDSLRPIIDDYFSFQNCADGKSDQNFEFLFETKKLESYI